MNHTTDDKNMHFVIITLGLTGDTMGSTPGLALEARKVSPTQTRQGAQSHFDTNLFPVLWLLDGGKTMLGCGGALMDVLSAGTGSRGDAVGILSLSS